jgi:hypothetical protein
MRHILDMFVSLTIQMKNPLLFGVSCIAYVVHARVCVYREDRFCTIWVIPLWPYIGDRRKGLQGIQIYLLGRVPALFTSINFLKFYNKFTQS